MQVWADKLISLQVTDRKYKEFYGGIMCPACRGRHGRIGDTIKGVHPAEVPHRDNEEPSAKMA